MLHIARKFDVAGRDERNREQRERSSAQTDGQIGDESTDRRCTSTKEGGETRNVRQQHPENEPACLHGVTHP